MQAIPDDEEMQICLEPPKTNENTYRTIETQTSILVKSHNEESESFLANESHTDQPSGNGILPQILQKFKKGKKGRSKPTDEQVNKMNTECQTEVIIERTDYQPRDQPKIEYLVDFPANKLDR